MRPPPVAENFLTGIYRIRFLPVTKILYSHLELDIKHATDSEQKDMDHRNRSPFKRSSCHPKGTGNRMGRLADLLTVIQEMTEKEFTGHIKINFSQGGIGRIEKYEEILRGTPQSD